MKKVKGEKDFHATLEKIAGDFFSENRLKSKNDYSLCIVGIQTRGVYLAERMAKYLSKKYKFTPLIGSLDITLYRDDVGEIGKQPLVKETNIPFDIEGKTILLVDDVLFTGRTIRAALDALLELGRPRFIRLAVMVDRKGRELPIQADYIGMEMNVKPDEEVQLKIKEVDKEDGIWIIKK